MILVALALAGSPETGALLAGLGGCRACHTGEGAPYAGGHAIETPYGTFYGSNLTPSPAGLGDWSFGDFKAAMREGRSPEGHSYWPAFPYEDFQLLTDDDLAHLWAYLQTLPPDDTPSLAHLGPAGWKRWAWRVLYFRKRSFDGDRGDYLIQAVGHCGACHTPRKKRGQRDWSRPLQGGTKPFNKAPPIDQGALGPWARIDLETFFEMGMLPDGDFTGSGMFRIIEEGTAVLPRHDRDALIEALTR